VDFIDSETIISGNGKQYVGCFLYVVVFVIAYRFYTQPPFLL